MPRSCRICPHGRAPDGVCGCPGFWSKKKSSSAISVPASATPSIGPSSDISKIQSSTSKLKPAEPIKQTCFFWYHGSCRREACQFEHRACITWPIVPPPGYQHFEPCKLSLCPLREDLVALNRRKTLEGSQKQLGGQFDGAVFSRATTVETGSRDDDSGGSAVSDTTDDDVENSSIISELQVGHAEGGVDEVQELDVVELPLKEESANTVHPLLPTKMPTGSSLRPDDYVDMTGIALPPQYREKEKEEDDKHVFSISHTSTLGKRRRSSPSFQSQLDYSEPYQQEPTPNLEGSVPILKRQRRTDHGDVKSIKMPQLAPFGEPIPQSGHDIPTKSASTFQGSEDYSQKPFDPPKGPRNLSSKGLICFYWYHKGYCSPKRNLNGPSRSCQYLHTSDVSYPQVSCPPGIDSSNHSGCQLPYCPARSRKNSTNPASSEKQSIMALYVKQNPWNPRDLDTIPVQYRDCLPPDQGGWGSYSPFMQFDTDSSIKGEHRSPVQHKQSLLDEIQKSSPRGTIAQPHLESDMQLSGTARDMPKPTGAATRNSISGQDERTEKCQVESDIVKDDLETQRDLKGRTKEKKRRAKRERRRKGRALRHQESVQTVKFEYDAVSMGPMVPYYPSVSADDGFMDILQRAPVPADAVAIPACRGGRRKNPLGSKRVRDLFEHEEAAGGEPDMFDQDISSDRESHQLVPEFSDPATSSDKKGGQTVADLFSAECTSKTTEAVEHGTIEMATVQSKCELPSGSDRLPWDTDLVRELFGEI
ncbi:hypothetical protein ACN47E_007858 [Coniothyrium glycines]